MLSTSSASLLWPLLKKRLKAVTLTGILNTCYRAVSRHGTPASCSGKYEDKYLSTSLGNTFRTLFSCFLTSYEYRKTHVLYLTQITKSHTAIHSL